MLYPYCAFVCIRVQLGYNSYNCLILCNTPACFSAFLNQSTIIPTLVDWNWSIYYGYLFAMFTLLHSSTNQKLFEKYLCNQNLATKSHYKNTNGALHHSYFLKLKYPLILLCQVCSTCYTAVQIKNCFEKNLCYQGSHKEKYGATICNHQINTIHGQQTWKGHKGGHW